ncbi:MAG: hypothetical protein ABIK82_10245 [Pseudomonadota bacterium]
MSRAPRLLPERIEVLLAPGALRLRRDGGAETRAVVADSEAAAWRAPLAALDHALQTRPPRAASGAAHVPAALAAILAPRLDIVLSEHFTRWQLLPWQPGADTAAEQEAVARHGFRETYGELARHWQVRCASEPPGVPTPACAIDDTLPAALRQVAESHGCRLGSLRPLFAAAAERWQRKLPRGIAWFAVLEAGRLNLGLLRERRWHALHGEPVTSPDQAGELLAGLVARSAIAAGIAPGEGRLLLCGEGADICPAPFPADNLQRLGSALAWTAARREAVRSV